MACGAAVNPRWAAQLFGPGHRDGPRRRARCDSRSPQNSATTPLAKRAAICNEAEGNAQAVPLVFHPSEPEFALEVEPCLRFALTASLLNMRASGVRAG